MQGPTLYSTDIWYRHIIAVWWWCHRGGCVNRVITGCQYCQPLTCSPELLWYWNAVVAGALHSSASWGTARCSAAALRQRLMCNSHRCLCAIKREGARANSLYTGTGSKQISVWYDIRNAAALSTLQKKLYSQSAQQTRITR